MQTRQIIFKFTTCKFYIFKSFFYRQNLKTVDISHAFLPLTIAKLSILKTVRFFPVAEPKVSKYRRQLMTWKNSRMLIFDVFSGSSCRVRSSRRFDVVGKRRWRSVTAAAAAAAAAARRAATAAAERWRSRPSRRRPPPARSSSSSRYRRSRPSRCSSSSTRRAAATRAPSCCTSSTGCLTLDRCSICRKAGREWRKSTNRPYPYNELVFPVNWNKSPSGINIRDYIPYSQFSGTVYTLSHTYTDHFSSLGAAVGRLCVSVSE